MSTDDESVDEEVIWIHDRRQEEGQLEYLVEYRGVIQLEWVDRSDLWDYDTVSRMINQYDRCNLIRWDTVCQHCGEEFGSNDGCIKHPVGCEECQCDECALYL